MQALLGQSPNWTEELDDKVAHVFGLLDRRHHLQEASPILHSCLTRLLNSVRLLKLSQLFSTDDAVVLGDLLTGVIEHGCRLHVDKDNDDPSLSDRDVVDEGFLEWAADFVEKRASKLDCKPRAQRLVPGGARKRHDVPEKLSFNASTSCRNSVSSLSTASSSGVGRGSSIASSSGVGRGSFSSLSTCSHDDRLSTSRESGVPRTHHFDHAGDRFQRLPWRPSPNTRLSKVEDETAESRDAWELEFLALDLKDWK
mmetsp:Transcript_33200/g.88878  ORF Transcript_33200/g.88878 Transcript_33200/m.88878 type:complete len:255 (-) Transcript_33200:273-1037(-)